MAHQHKSRGQRATYVKGFEQRYGMNREEWRKLKKEDPQAANLIRVKLASRFLGFQT